MGMDTTQQSTGAALKPTVFLSSSEEGAGLADAVRSLLERDCRVLFWIDSLVELDAEKRDCLVEAVEQADLAILFLAGDELEPRKNSSRRLRDQVILELGVFMGVLGWDRTLLLCREDRDVDLPFQGINVARYAAARGERELPAAVESAYLSIRKAFEDLQVRVGREGLSHRELLASRDAELPPRSSEIDQLYEELRQLVTQEESPDVAEKIQERLEELRALQEEEADWLQRNFESRLHLKPGTGWKTLEKARRLLEDEDPASSDLPPKKQN